MEYPFRQKQISGKLIREFSRDVDSSELVWHRDRSDRIVRVIKGSGWHLQLENNLPTPLRPGSLHKIPAETYHRVIKGQSDLVVEITENKVDLVKEFIRNTLSESLALACPLATKDVALNTKNRNATRQSHMYGPLNPSEPGDYWEKIANKWQTDVEAAKKSLCGNCVAFDISPRMKDCMPGEVSEGAGELGYCWMHHFKCASLRTCDTWAFGGPISEDRVSLGWQEKAKI